MMNYAPGADVPRKVLPAGTVPQPPGSSRRGKKRTSSSSDRIDYSDNNTLASRRGEGIYFDLNPDTNLADPLDNGGFFRVSGDGAGGIRVEYRINRPIFGLFSRLISSSQEIDALFISLQPGREEFSHEDILIASLELMERRKLILERSNPADKNRLSIERLSGDYPPSKASL